MKAIWNDTIIAEAPKEELISIESNWYFPPESVAHEVITKSDLRTTCPWKGEANYFNVSAAGETNTDAAWYYPEPKSGALDRVGKDFTNYVAFWRGVTVSE